MDQVTVPRATVQQVLEALEERYIGALRDQAMDTLRAALAQPEQDVPETGCGNMEPVAWMYHGIRFDDTPHDSPSLIWRPEHMDAMSASQGAKATPLYAEPPRRDPEQEPVAWSDARLRGIASDYFPDAKDWPAAMLCLRHLLMEQAKYPPASARVPLTEQPDQEPVAWIDDSEHPKHRLYRQSATEKRLYGPLRPLYAAPTSTTTTQPEPK